MADNRVYKVTLYYHAQRDIEVTAKSRQEAIEEADTRAAQLGLDVFSMRVPHLEGDE